MRHNGYGTIRLCREKFRFRVTIKENELERQMEHEMEAGFPKGTIKFMQCRNPDN